MARLDRFYTPLHSRLGIHQRTYFIHGYPVGSNHSLVQIEISIGSGEERKMLFKWNVSCFPREIIDMLKEQWNRCPRDASFFYKLRHITIMYKQVSK